MLTAVIKTVHYLLRRVYVNLLVAHMMGDYFLQNNWMAMNKTSKSYICAIHCLLYTLSVAVICQWLDWRLVVVFVSHFIMDRFRLAVYWRRFFSGDDYTPWVITADNSIHLLVLLFLN